MKPRTITVQRAFDLTQHDPTFIPWLRDNGLDDLHCWRLTAENDLLTVWRADCYDTIENTMVLDDFGDPVSRAQFIETTPGKEEWCE